ncbi:hypothetical protein AgCh_013105 [Apium graveolens]
MLVGRFLTEKNINFNAMQNVLASLWRPKQGLEVHDLGEQRYAFIFYHILDVRKVLEGGPWSFEHNLLGPDFVEVDGIVREKSGVQSGITVISRNQGDREEFEIQNTDNDAGINDVVVELKRKRMKGNTDGNNGPSHMIMDGLVENTVAIYDPTKLEDNSKNLLGAGSVDQARLAK